MTDTSRKLFWVEAGRGIAALLVVAVHVSHMLSDPKYVGAYPFGGLFRFGHAGVDFFFVLSGFIIYWVHRQDFSRPARLRRFAWKRFVRIFPAYWVVLAAMYALLIVSPTRGRDEQAMATIATSLTLLPSLHIPALNVAWTLRHEVLFYALFALLIVGRRLGWAALCAWWALVAWNIAVGTVTGAPAFGGLAGELFFRQFNIEFGLGILVASLLMRGPSWRPIPCLAAGITLFLGAGLAEDWGPTVPPEWPPFHLCYGVGAALALYGVVGVEYRHDLRPPRWLIALGAASYALYLTHTITAMILMQGVALLHGRVAWPLEPLFLAVCAACVAVALVFHRVIERPLMRWVGHLHAPLHRPIAMAEAAGPVPLPDPTGGEPDSVWP